MKVRIFDQPPEPPEKKQEIFLALTAEEDRVVLMVVDQDGGGIDAGHLLSIGDDGAMTLFGGINEDLGLRTTEMGCLRVRRE